jgi:hypothetical protein
VGRGKVNIGQLLWSILLKRNGLSIKNEPKWHQIWCSLTGQHANTAIKFLNQTRYYRRFSINNLTKRFPFRSEKSSHQRQSVTQGLRNTRSCLGQMLWRTILWIIYKMEWLAPELSRLQRFGLILEVYWKSTRGKPGAEMQRSCMDNVIPCVEQLGLGMPSCWWW